MRADVTEATSRSQLYLVVDASGDALSRVSAALTAAKPATLLLKAGAAGKPDAVTLKPIVELAQAQGVATLVADDPQLARTVRADGVHLCWSRDIEARLAEAREILGTRYIIGAEAGYTRHDAMVLGEAGADYVAFPPPPPHEATDTAWADHLDNVAWWAEIFEVPCVAFGAETPEDVADFTDAGADFVAVSLATDLTADRIPSVLSEAAAALVRTANAA